MQKQISSKKVYEAAIFTMTHDEIELENGMRTDRDVIHHNGGAAILVMKDERILLVSQYRYAVGTQLWELPAGKVEIGETPDVCAMRELEEESGYRCESLALLSEFFTTPGFCSERITVFEAKVVTKAENPRPMDEDEMIDTKWFTLDEIKAMLEHHQLQDAKTIIALQQVLIREINKLR